VVWRRAVLSGGNRAFRHCPVIRIVAPAGSGRSPPADGRQARPGVGAKPVEPIALYTGPFHVGRLVAADAHARLDRPPIAAAAGECQAHSLLHRHVSPVVHAQQSQLSSTACRPRSIDERRTAAAPTVRPSSSGQDPDAGFGSRSARPRMRREERAWEVVSERLDSWHGRWLFASGLVRFLAQSRLCFRPCSRCGWFRSMPGLRPWGESHVQCGSP
jgi:hypothetical protein